MLNRFSSIHFSISLSTIFIAIASSIPPMTDLNFLLSTSDWRVSPTAIRSISGLFRRGVMNRRTVFRYISRADERTSTLRSRLIRYFTIVSPACCAFQRAFLAMLSSHYRSCDTFHLALRLLPLLDTQGYQQYPLQAASSFFYHGSHAP